MDNVKQLGSVQQLHELTKDPAGAYLLTADLDMDGVQWIPVAGFTGSFDGGGHTIRNLTVTDTDGQGNMGLFGELAGTVRQLKLDNITVRAGDAARYAGTVAGTVSGTVENCTATGLVCAEHGDICAGCLAGRVLDGGSVAGGRDITVQAGPDGKYAAEGLAADVKLFVPETAKTGLVGQAADGCPVIGLWRDSAHSSQRQSEVLRGRRQKVVHYMRAMGTVKWRVDQELLEYKKNDKGDPSIHYQRYERGKTYMGIPYAHSAGSRARFLSRMTLTQDADGVYTAMPGLENGSYYVGARAEELADQGIHSKDIFGFVRYMGNDCSSAVSWSWRQVSSVDIAEGGCYGLYSGDMIPTAENEKLYGILPAGGLTAESSDTRLTIRQLGDEPFLEAYARAKMGDALVGYGDGGHVRLLSFDPVVIRDGAGKIEAKKSFFITIEQGDGFFDSKALDNYIRADLTEPINYSWRVDFQHVFYNLLHPDSFTEKAQHRAVIGCGHYYLPITMQALQVEDTPAVTPRVWVEGAAVHSNFYIICTQVGDSRVYTHVAQHWEDYRKDPVVFVDLAKTHGLQPGTYTAQVQLSNEETRTVEVTVE